MRFARQARIFKGPLDPAPMAAVLMLLLMFMLVSSLLYTPGVKIELPKGDHLTITENPTVVVAVDSRGQYFFENKPVQEAELKAALKNRLQSAKRQSKKLTMVLWSDKAAAYEIVLRLETLAEAAGVTDVLVAERPTPFDSQR